MSVLMNNWDIVFAIYEKWDRGYKNLFEEDDLSTSSFPFRFS